MRTIVITVILLAVATASCDKLLNPTNGGTQGPARYLFFKYTEIPSTMTDEAAIAQIHDTRDNFIRTNFTQKIFPVTDSMVVGGYMLALNHLIITTQPGRAEVHGGQSESIHPFAPGVPSSLTLNVFNGNEVGVIIDYGDWSIEFGDGTVVATGGENDFLEYTLESYDASRLYGTGRFAFIAHTQDNPPRRWAIFDGEFALTRGRN